MAAGGLQFAQEPGRIGTRGIALRHDSRVRCLQVRIRRFEFRETLLKRLKTLRSGTGLNRLRSETLRDAVACGQEAGFRHFRLFGGGREPQISAKFAHRLIGIVK